LVSLQVVDSAGKLAYSNMVLTGYDGRYSTQFTIAPISPPGLWRVLVRVFSVGAIVASTETSIAVETTPNPVYYPHGPYILTVESDRNSYQPGTIVTWRQDMK
jgi:hypothetical protein